MEHLKIRSVTVIRPSVVTADTSDLLATWIGQYAQTKVIKKMCRQYKMAIGWRKYKVRFAEFDCRGGLLILRALKIDDPDV